MTPVETLTHAGVTVTLVRTDPPGVSPARWYQARRYQVLWYDVFLSHITGDRGEKIGGVERFKTLSGAKPTTRVDLRTPLTTRQYRQLKWRYYTDDYAPASSTVYGIRRPAIEDLLRNTARLSGLGRDDIKRLSYVGTPSRR
jgi:hypothetical protein